MGQKYIQLTQQERDDIFEGKLAGKSLREIAEEMGRSPSTISREIRRNAPPVHQAYYLPHKAQQRADERRQAASRKERLRSPRIKAYVTRQIRQGWSPEIIAGRLKKLGWEDTVSHEAIYQWIYAKARDLIPYLTRSHRKRQKRGHSRKHRKAHIPGRISIDKRPAIVTCRKRTGDWEADTIVSRESKPCLQIIVDRKSRLSMVKRMRNREASTMRKTIIQRLKHLPSAFLRTITYDNGVENVEHEQINQALGTRSYFCAPYTSQEKGTVENRAGLVRRHFPKGTDFAKLTPKEIRRVERWMNNRPMKILGYKTPREVFYHGVALRG